MCCAPGPTNLVAGRLYVSTTFATPPKPRQRPVCSVYQSPVQIPSHATRFPRRASPAGAPHARPWRHRGQGFLLCQGRRYSVVRVRVRVHACASPASGHVVCFHASATANAAVSVGVQLLHRGTEPLASPCARRLQVLCTAGPLLSRVPGGRPALLPAGVTAVLPSRQRLSAAGRWAMARSPLGLAPAGCVPCGSQLCPQTPPGSRDVRERAGAPVKSLRPPVPLGSESSGGVGPAVLFPRAGRGFARSPQPAPASVFCPSGAVCIFPVFLYGSKLGTSGRSGGGPVGKRGLFRTLTCASYSEPRVLHEVSGLVWPG